MQLFKERFTGHYDGVSPPSLLPAGSIVDGKNVRVAGTTGGWRCRSGSTLLNTTAAESGKGIASLHYYINPRHRDSHFFTQINNKLLGNTTATFNLLTESSSPLLLENSDDLLGVSSADALEQVTDLGASLGVVVGNKPGFSAISGEQWFYADGSGAPITFGGNTPSCVGFVVWDSSEIAATDYTKEVIDVLDTKVAVLGSGASDSYFVGSPEIADSINLSFGSVVNNNAATATVSAWRAGAWTDVSASDGTAVAGATHAIDGSLEWTRNSADRMKVIGGVMAYWYRVTFSAAIDAATVRQCTVCFDATTVTPKWDGTWQYLGGILFYDQSIGEYQDALGDLSVETGTTYLDISAMQTADYIYIKTPDIAAGFGFGIVRGYSNTNAALIDEIGVWTGNAWTALTTNIEDQTLDGALDSSFSQTGKVWFDAAVVTPQRRTLKGDPVPGYWYRISISAALSADVRIYLGVYAAYPEALSTYTGCVEFNGSLVLWGDSLWPNRLRYSAPGMPDHLSGTLSGYSEPIGDDSEILVAKNFGSFLLVWKRNGLFAVDGDYKVTKVSSKGIVAPKSASVVEVGTEGLQRDEVVNVAIWQAQDGTYLTYGTSTKKISLPVDNYFNPYYDDCLGASELLNLQAFTDQVNNEYHLILPTIELVYNTKLNGWYPPFQRYYPLTCGIDLIDQFGQQRTFGGCNSGYVIELEIGIEDQRTLTTTVGINHSIKTRALMAISAEGLSTRFTFRKLWTAVKAMPAGIATIKLYSNLSNTGVAYTTPTTMSLAESNAGMAVPIIEVSIPNLNAIQVGLEYITTRLTPTYDSYMEVWEIIYILDTIGEIL